MWIIRNTIRIKDPDYYTDRSAEVCIFELYLVYFFHVFSKIDNILCFIYYIYIINIIYI